MKPFVFAALLFLTLPGAAMDDALRNGPYADLRAWCADKTNPSQAAECRNYYNGVMDALRTVERLGFLPTCTQGNGFNSQMYIQGHAMLEKQGMALDMSAVRFATTVFIASQACAGI